MTIMNQMLALLSLTLLLCAQACTNNSSSNTSESTAESAEFKYSFPKTVEEAQDDLVGNWLLDMTASKGAGLKDAIKERVTFSVVMDPNGERSVYRGDQVIEKGQLNINKVEGNGRILGTFIRAPGTAPLGVTIQIHDEGKIEWRFESSERLEILKRKDSTPDPEYAK